MPMRTATPGFDLERRVADHVAALCAQPDRNVGGPGNLAAGTYVAAELRALGFEVAATEFDCLTWESGGAWLAVGDEPFEVLPGPYSNPAEVARFFADVVRATR